MYTYIYTYMFVYTYVCMYTYISYILVASDEWAALRGPTFDAVSERELTALYAT